jgi:hypothetical protein
MRAEFRHNGHTTDALFADLVIIPESEAEKILLSQLEFASLCGKLKFAIDVEESEAILTMTGMDK